MQKSPVSKWILVLLGAVITATIMKIGLLSTGGVPFNSDEAIVALMAKHILQGERPFFFYGQAYMGSLDAYLVAGVYEIIGEQVFAVRIVQIILYSLTLITTAMLGKQLTGQWKVGILSAWLLAIPNVNMTLYTTVSLGGYGEMLVLGNLILIITSGIAREIAVERDKLTVIPIFALGFLSGFGLWVFGLTLVYAIPAFLYLAWVLNHSKRGVTSRSANGAFQASSSKEYRLNQLVFSLNQRMVWGVAFVGIAVGATPWWAYAQNAGVANLLLELGGGAISGVESLSLAGQFLQHIVNLSLFGSTVILGLRPPWEIRWLALPLAPLVLIFWGSVLIYAIKKTRRDIINGPRDPGYSHTPLIAGVVMMIVTGFILLPFGADPSGRYFLPVSVVMSVFASQAVWKWQIKWGKIIWILAGTTIVFNIWGTIQSVQSDTPGITTQFDAVTQVDHSYDQELIEFLEKNGEYWGYTNYWVSYPLVFHSAERMIYIPRLPYHQDLRYTPRDNRYEPYDLIVQNSDRTAYITTNNPNLDQKIRVGLMAHEVSWQETRIGDYLVFYQLSRNLRPEDIGLGEFEG